MGKRDWLILSLIATAYTLLNSVKPLQVDDAAYYYFASHIAAHPLDPYGFNHFWYQHPQPAMEILSPPALPYWWAAGIALFGDHPLAWKLWLFPVTLLFVFSLHSILRRFCPGLALPLTCMTVFSPAFLPSLNYMLDVPAVALGLAALHLFFRACDLRSVWRAAVGGVIAGVAMETKYTAFLVTATMALYAASAQRRSLWSVVVAMLALVAAVAVFASWEFWIAYKYGKSHFLFHLANNERSLWDQIAGFTVPLLLLLGALIPDVALLGVQVLSRRRWLATGMAAVVTCGFLVIFAAGSLPVIPHPRWPISLERVLYFVSGLWVAGVMCAVGLRLLRRSGDGSRDSVAWFLLLWLGLEVVGYFIMTPFAAVRRVLVIVVVATILVGRLAALSHPSARMKVFVWLFAIFQMIAGLAFYAVDLQDAFAAKNAAEDSAFYIRQRDPNATIHFTGHWGFQFYGERAGMIPVYPDDAARPLRQGDWLVVPFEPYEQQRIRIDPSVLALEFHLALEDVIRLRTVRCFYGTSSGAPLEHLAGPRMAVDVYRVTADFVPRSR